VKKKLITVDRFHMQKLSNDDYVELSKKKEIANVAEESFALGDVKKRSF
jgi:hypothetical protein